MATALTLDLACPECRAPLDPTRILSDPWRQRMPGARRFQVSTRGARPYVLSCGACLCAVQVELSGAPQVVEIVARGERLRELGRALQHYRDPWDMVGPMLAEPFHAELLGTPELFARMASGLGDFVRLVHRCRVDLRAAPDDLHIPVGPRNVVELDALPAGPRLPMAFKLFPVGLRNGLPLLRADRIKGDRQLPELVVPWDWLRLQPDSYTPPAELPSLPSPAPPAPVEPVWEEEEEEVIPAAPEMPADPFDLPEPAGLMGLEPAAEVTLAPTSPRETVLEQDLDAAALEGWGDDAEDEHDENSHWTAPREALGATELPADLLELLTARLGPPLRSFEDLDAPLPLRVHAFQTPGDARCVTLVSDGMRQWEMPALGSGPRRVELMWSLSEDLAMELDDWALQLFLRLARSPHDTQSATWPGDVMGPLRPGFGETGLKNALLWPTQLLDEVDREPLTAVGRTTLLAIWPLSRMLARQAEDNGGEGVIRDLSAAGRDERFTAGGVGRS
ncbi:MAG: suppressor of fused domain protein [Myxococcota bacterium]|nr:suppressor of fused domain protein [Myxococcota bacterium]